MLCFTLLLLHAKHIKLQNHRDFGIGHIEQRASCNPKQARQSVVVAVGRQAGFFFVGYISNHKRAAPRND